MSYSRNYRSHGGTVHEDRGYGWNNFHSRHRNSNMNVNGSNGYNSSDWNYDQFRDFVGKYKDHNCYSYNSKFDYVNLPLPPPPQPPHGLPSLKRRKFNSGTWGEGERHFLPTNAYESTDSGRRHTQMKAYESTDGGRRHAPMNAYENTDGGRCYSQMNTYENSVAAGYYSAAPHPVRLNGEVSTSGSKRDRSKLEEDEPVFMSRDEIERYSPSRKDGIDVLRETHLRYSYCAFLQNLGLQLDLPQTTIGTAMVLCHRFFVRRSHACHDRFLIATAALFLAAKSEETPRPLSNVLRTSCEIYHKQDITLLSYLLPVDWFEQYRERVLEAEQMILTTLNFELNVKHPYDPLTSVLNKLGLSHSALVDLALNLVSEGLRSSLWLQFKPQHIAAGAAYLAAKFLNLDLSSYQNIWMEFQTTPAILHDVEHQLMELFK